MAQGNGFATRTVNSEEYGAQLERVTRAYTSVKIRDFFVETVMPFEIFYPAFEEARQNLFLEVLLPEGKTYNQSMHDWLVRQGIEEVYIRKEKEGAFFDYLSANVKDILHASNVPLLKKAMLVYDSAESIVSKVFGERPSRSNIALGCELVENIALHIGLDDMGSSALLGIFSKDYYTFTHSVQVAMLGMAFCTYLKWSKEEVVDFGIGALFHDVGKSHVDDEILNKPSRLTTEEFEVIKKHSIMGYQKLKETQTMSVHQLTVPLSHHEAMDGSGYPKGLRGEQIHKYARVARIVDCYDALTTKRSYKNALPAARALEIMTTEMGPTFDRRLLQDFVNYIQGEGKVEATEQGKRLNLELGNEVYLEIAESDLELKTTLMGMEAGKVLILRVPTGMGIEEHLSVGKEVTARYIQAGTSYRFKSAIIIHVPNPVPLVIVTYPRHIDSLEMRSNSRSDCLIRSMVTVQGMHYMGVVLNIGVGGCKVVLKLTEDNPLPGMDIGDGVQVRVSLTDGQKPPVIPGIIRNMNLSKGKALLGIQFGTLCGKALAAIQQCAGNEGPQYHGKEN